MSRRWRARPAFAEKSWGSFTVLDVQPEATTIRIVLNSGHRMTYHSHEHRDEVWTIVSGMGRAVVTTWSAPCAPATL